MSVNQTILDLISEDINPFELALEADVEDTIELEESTIFGDAEDDDEIIGFIDNGKFGYDNPIDFSDEVEDVLEDDICN